MANGATQNSVVLQLKELTKETHQRVEQNSRILKADFTREDYCRHLQGVYAFHRSWEVLCRETELPKSFREMLARRQKTAWLKQDLEELLGGGDWDKLAFPMIKISDPMSCPLFFGRFYVVEGSMLGGQVIAKHLKAKLGLSEESGLRFYSGYGERTGEMWQETKGFIESQLRPTEVTSAARAANEMFKYFAQCQSVSASSYRISHATPRHKREEDGL